MEGNQKVYHMETKPVQTVVCESKGGTGITNLGKLRDTVGKKTVDMLFTEYVMELIAKAELLDRISDAVANETDIQAVKEILYEKDGRSSDEVGSII